MSVLTIGEKVLRLLSVMSSVVGTLSSTMLQMMRIFFRPNTIGTLEAVGREGCGEKDKGERKRAKQKVRNR
jgi:hypothetical protein